MTQQGAAVQLAPDSTGKGVRTLEVTAMQKDGTYVTVEMQVVAIADKSGRVINASELADLPTQIEILRQLRRIAANTAAIANLPLLEDPPFLGTRG